MLNRYPEDLAQLIAQLKKLPGVGTRTAERFAFELLRWDTHSLNILSDALKTLSEKVIPCTTCGCLTQEHQCRFCTKRDTRSLCIIASPRDAYFIEEATHYKGLFHVLEHLLSPLDGRLAASLKLDRIEKRIAEQKVEEVILALDSTLEADATALYLRNALAKEHLSISRLAFGIPLGSSLESIDGGTLARALAGRQTFSG